MQISSQSLLKNRESSVSAAKRERRKSETFLEGKSVSPPKSPSRISSGQRSPDLGTGMGVSTGTGVGVSTGTGTGAGMRVSTNVGVGVSGVGSRGERQRRFSVDGGIVEARPNRRASDTSITSTGSDLMLADSKRRHSSRCSFSGGSPNALLSRPRTTSTQRKTDISPGRMSRVYSFPEIYDTPMALELDADDEMVRPYVCVRVLAVGYTISS